MNLSSEDVFGGTVNLAQSAETDQNLPRRSKCTYSGQYGRMTELPRDLHADTAKVASAIE